MKYSLVILLAELWIGWKMKHLFLLIMLFLCCAVDAEELATNFTNPPRSARPWVYWWWLNGCVTKDGIVRDLDFMESRGMGGALVFNAGKGETPFKTEFMSSEWRGLFRFALDEAAKRGIVISLNICDGWNAGGPWIKPDLAARTLCDATASVIGGKEVDVDLPVSSNTSGYYEDIAVFAWRASATNGICQSSTMIDLSDKLKNDRLRWDAPEGTWQVCRFGSYIHQHARTKITGGERHWEADPLRPEGIDLQFASTAGVLIKEVGDHVGKTFKHVSIDSGEIGKPDWTPAFRNEFKKRRGYDPFPYLAVKAGLTVDSAEQSARFDEDYDKTLGNLMVENYYGRLSRLARERGLQAHSESAGYQKPCVDASHAMGENDICMSEFWVNGCAADRNYIHQLSSVQLGNHDGIRNAASAAHTYGRKIVMAESFTVVNAKQHFPNYTMGPYSLKNIGDRAFCAGMNHLTMHNFVSQPVEADKPGYLWPRIGTEFNRHVTWMALGHDWVKYLSRCQQMLRQGVFAADVCYFNGEWVPDYVPARWAMNPELPRGYDCDVINSDVLFRDAKAGEDGRLELAGGMKYRYLVLGQGGRWNRASHKELFPQVYEDGQVEAQREFKAKPSAPMAVSPALLSKIKNLVESGVTLVGPPPARAIGLSGYPQSDAEVAKLSKQIWGDEPAAEGERMLGKGRVIWGKRLEKIFEKDGLRPDLEIRETTESGSMDESSLEGIPNPGGSFDWIHRTMGNNEVYFAANLRNAKASGVFRFRVAGRKPELWDAVTAAIRDLPEYEVRDNSITELPLVFEPKQSFFIVFRTKANPPAAAGVRRNFPESRILKEISGPWDVSFDRDWFYPDNGTGGNVRFAKLEDWVKRPEEAVKYFSGTAVYRKTFELSLDSNHSDPGAGKPPLISDRSLYLDLGVVKEIARVKLNGKDLGTLWCSPWKVDISKAARNGENQLEIEIVNLWPNRLIGDSKVPPDRRKTRTNISPQGGDLISSGLLGPVSVTAQE